MEGIIDILAARRIDAADVQMSEIFSILEFFLRNGEFLALRRQAGIGSLTELFDLDVVL